MMIEGSRAAAREIECIGAPVIYAECTGENHQSTIMATMPQIMREAFRRM